MNLSRVFLLLFVVTRFCAAVETPLEISLWEKGAPGFESRRNEPAEAKDWWIKNIHNPSITAYFPPKEKATGAAVLICPGGGHRELVFNGEGAEPAQFLASQGIAAFALKYRLARETNSPYKIELHARADGERAMRMIRSRAAEWNIDTNRVGIMGFSAGGEVVSLVTYDPAEADSAADDTTDRLSARPNFQVYIYPGPIGIPEIIPTNAPPAFLLVANDDRGASGVIARLFQKFRDAKVPVEAHIFARGGHGFNMGNRSKLQTIRGWPQRLAEWLADNNFLNPDQPPKGAK